MPATTKRVELEALRRTQREEEQRAASEARQLSQLYRELHYHECEQLARQERLRTLLAQDTSAAPATSVSSAASAHASARAPGSQPDGCGACASSASGPASGQQQHPLPLLPVRDNMEEGVNGSSGPLSSRPLPSRATRRARVVLGVCFPTSIEPDAVLALVEKVHERVCMFADICVVAADDFTTRQMDGADAFERALIHASLRAQATHDARATKTQLFTAEDRKPPVHGLAVEGAAASIARWGDVLCVVPLCFKYLMWLFDANNSADDLLAGVCAEWGGVPGGREASKARPSKPYILAPQLMAEVVQDRTRARKAEELMSTICHRWQVEVVHDPTSSSAGGRGGGTTLSRPTAEELDEQVAQISEHVRHGVQAAMGLSKCDSRLQAVVDVPGTRQCSDNQILYSKG